MPTITSSHIRHKISSGNTSERKTILVVVALFWIYIMSSNLSFTYLVDSHQHGYLTSSTIWQHWSAKTLDSNNKLGRHCSQHGSMGYHTLKSTTINRSSPNSDWIIQLKLGWEIVPFVEALILFLLSHEVTSLPQYVDFISSIFKLDTRALLKNISALHTCSQQQYIIIK